MRTSLSVGCFCLVLCLSVVIPTGFAQYDAKYDHNNDGVIDALDLLEFQEHWHAMGNLLPTSTPSPTPSMTPTPTHTPPAQTRGRVQGFVTDLSDLPLSGAVVTIGTETTRSEGDGYYDLVDLATGPQRIEAQKPGYEDYRALITVTALTYHDIPMSLPGQCSITILLPGDVPLDMVPIPAGSFMMGSTDDSSWSWCYPCEQPAHQVAINNVFYMGKTEITQAQWLAVMGSWPGNPPSSTYGQGDNYPAYSISWDDCQNFIAALNQLGQGTFRLPSEAEWEYACRAGTTTRFYFGDSNCSPGESTSCDLDNYAWWFGNSGDFGSADYGSKPVGGKLPNAFGLYDMHGNVYEWCQDYWHDGYSGAPSDGIAWELPASSDRVYRGNYWHGSAVGCRSAARYNSSPDFRHSSTGFRVVRTP